MPYYVSYFNGILGKCAYVIAQHETRVEYTDSLCKPFTRIKSAQAILQF